MRDCVALGMEDFCAYATLLDFGDNLRCMKQVAGSLVRQGIFQSVASQAAPCNLASKAHSVTGCRIILHKPCNLAGKACSVTGCRLTSCAMQPRRQSLLGHGLSPYKKTISHCFLRERAPDEAVGVCFFAWLVAFVKI